MERIKKTIIVALLALSCSTPSLAQDSLSWHDRLQWILGTYIGTFTYANNVQENKISYIVPVPNSRYNFKVSVGMTQWGYEGSLFCEYMSVCPDSIIGNETILISDPCTHTLTNGQIYPDGSIYIAFCVPPICSSVWDPILSTYTAERLVLTKEPTGIGPYTARLNGLVARNVELEEKGFYYRKWWGTNDWIKVEVEQEGGGDISADLDLEPNTQYLCYCYVKYDGNHYESEKVVFKTLDSVGITDWETEGYSLFPNPTAGTLTLRGADLRQAEVYDIAGQRLLCQPVGEAEATIDLNALAKGLYFMRVSRNDGKQAVRKVIVE